MSRSVSPVSGKPYSLAADIDSLDATIRLFAPDIDLAALRPKHMAPPDVEWRMLHNTGIAQAAEHR